MNHKNQSDELFDIAKIFLKLGFTSFGGPAAHIAMMNHEFVIKRQWLTSEHFLDLLSATNFIPGPNSTEMAIHIGYSRAGWKGLLTAGICFILPAALLVVLLANLYVQWGMLPNVQAFFYGMKPVILAIIFLAIISFYKTAVKNKFLLFLGLATIITYFLGVNELILIIIAGMISFILNRHQTKKLYSLMILNLMNLSPIVSSTGIQGALSAEQFVIPFSLSKLFLFFIKVGSVLFGSGYVLLAFLKSDLVEHWHWLTNSQLLDAIAIGQFTPGPVFTTATFIGFLLGGNSGAILATVGIFLPAFIFVGISAPWIKKIRKSMAIASVLDGVNVASLAVMIAVTLQLSRESVFDPLTLVLFLLSLLGVQRFKINSVWLVIVGGVLGLLISPKF